MFTRVLFGVRCCKEMKKQKFLALLVPFLLVRDSVVGITAGFSWRQFLFLFIQRALYVRHEVSQQSNPNQKSFLCSGSSTPFSRQQTGGSSHIYIYVLLGVTVIACSKDSHSGRLNRPF
jgi:hypothetical protein